MEHVTDGHIYVFEKPTLIQNQCIHFQNDK